MSVSGLRHGATARADGSRLGEQLAWYGGGLLVGFVVPFLFTSVLDLNHDLYYGLYFAAALTFLAAYVRSTGVDVIAAFTRRWQWSLALGVLAAAAVVASVFMRDATPRPDGPYFAFTLVWRGVLYGAVDALLLSAFPVAVAFTVLGGRLDGLVRKLSFGVAALVLVMIITAVYHLGYEQFRERGVAEPEMGNAVISLPMILTLNPLGSVVAHSSMHVAANLHAYETEVYLPPRRSAN